MSRLDFNLEKETEFSTMDNYVFLTELEHVHVTSKEVAYFINHDSLLSKVCNYINHGWPNIPEEQSCSKETCSKVMQRLSS